MATPPSYAPSRPSVSINAPFLPFNMRVRGSQPSNVPHDASSREENAPLIGNTGGPTSRFYDAVI